MRCQKWHSVAHAHVTFQWATKDCLLLTKLLLLKICTYNLTLKRGRRRRWQLTLCQSVIFHFWEICYIRHTHVSLTCVLWWGACHKQSSHQHWPRTQTQPTSKKEHVAGLLICFDPCGSKHHAAAICRGCKMKHHFMLQQLCKSTRGKCGHSWRENHIENTERDLRHIFFVIL